MSEPKLPAVLVLCTVEGGRDAVVEVLRRGFPIAAIVGLHPDEADPLKVSGYIDVGEVGRRWNVPYCYVKSYALNDRDDEAKLKAIKFDMIWVAGWQRLVPPWLIAMSRTGVLGIHGSPDGIQGGRGRSPQNWALMLGCRQFDLALFRITEGVDEGPVLASRSFVYREDDDIAVSYHRMALAMADMVIQFLSNLHPLHTGIPQSSQGFYYPQRKPEDGMTDWHLGKSWISAHCRALTRPYPGLRTTYQDVSITIWRCQPFDDVIDAEVGTVSACFSNDDFLVNCLDGRVLVRDWQARPGEWRPQPGMTFDSVRFSDQMRSIIERHEKRHPGKPIAPRIRRWTE